MTNRKNLLDRATAALKKASTGPWYAGPYDEISDEICVSGAGNEYVASIDCDGCWDDISSGTILSNAELIALAPDLTNALIAAEKMADIGAALALRVSHIAGREYNVIKWDEALAEYRKATAADTCDGT